MEVTINVQTLNKIGIGVDFLDIKNHLDFLLKKLDHKNLNKIEPFRKINPTSENIAIWLFQNLSKRIDARGIKLASVSVRESSQFKATYYGKKTS